MGRNVPEQNSKKRLTRRRPARQQQPAACDTAQVISSVAQGLAQAQTQQQRAASPAEQEILRVLQQIEQHLAAEKSGNSGGMGANVSGNTLLSDTAGRPNMLRQLLTALQARTSQQQQGGMAGGGSAGSGQDGPGMGQDQGGMSRAGQNTDTGMGQGGGLNAGTGQGTTSAQGNAGAGGNQGQTGAGLDAQTAAQLLSQAQYELANELEASLQKLRQVIDESEKIATKVGTLLQQQQQQQQ